MFYTYTSYCWPNLLTNWNIFSLQNLPFPWKSLQFKESCLVLSLRGSPIKTLAIFKYFRSCISQLHANIQTWNFHSSLAYIIWYPVLIWANNKIYFLSHTFEYKKINLVLNRIITKWYKLQPSRSTSRNKVRVSYLSVMVL